MKINHIVDPIKKRIENYPKIEDQLDALWKGGDELDKMKAKIRKVKEDYPKKVKKDFTETIEQIKL